MIKTLVAVFSIVIFVVLSGVSALGQNRAVVTDAPARVPLTRQGGVQYEVMQRPSLVSIYQALEYEEGGTLRVTELGQRSSLERCGGTRSSRVLVTNHGVPMNVWVPQKDAPSGFVEAYVDFNGDDEVDPNPYKVLDIGIQSQVFMTWRAGDEIEIVYLRESGKVLAIPGLPLQTIWRRVVVEDDTPRGCKPAEVDRPGGGRKMNAYDMWRVWPSR